MKVNVKRILQILKPIVTSICVCIVISTFNIFQAQEFGRFIDKIIPIENIISPSSGNSYALYEMDTFGLQILIILEFIIFLALFITLKSEFLKLFFLTLIIFFTPTLMAYGYSGESGSNYELYIRPFGFQLIDKFILPSKGYISSLNLLIHYSRWSIEAKNELISFIIISSTYILLLGRIIYLKTKYLINNKNTCA